MANASRSPFSGCHSKLGPPASVIPLRTCTCWVSLAVVFLVWALYTLPVEAARVADRIVAIVNGDVITLSEIKQETRAGEEKLRRQYEGPDLNRRLRQLEFRALTGLIERTLQIQLAKERGHEPTEDEVQAAMQEFQLRGEKFDASDPQVKRDVRQQLTLLRVLQREVQSAVMISEPELKQYYDAHLSRFTFPEEYRISQILIRPRRGEGLEGAQQRAGKVYAMAKEGADFADLARTRSDGREARLGGSLGLVRQGELEPPLERTIAELKPGDVSKPIKTDDGFHILRLDERKPPKYKPYEQVKREVQILLSQQKSEAQYHRWIHELENKAHIEVKF